MRGEGKGREATNVDFGKSDEDLKKIARGVLNNTVFISDQIPAGQQKRLLAKVFLPLSFAELSFLEELQKNDVVCCFSYLNEALDRAVNGFPMFTEVGFLTRGDHSKMIGYLKKMEAALNDV